MGKFSRAVGYWPTDELVSERHVEPPCIPSLSLKEHCARSRRWPKSVRAGCKTNVVTSLFENAENKIINPIVFSLFYYNST